MFRNPLYYFPVEANRLYHAEKGSKEYKKLTAEIVAKTNGMYVNDDEVFTEYTAKIKRRLIAVFVFAVVGFASFAAMQITDKIDSDADLIFALFFCVGMLSCIITIFLSIFVVRLRRKLVQHLLKDYTPACEEFGEEVLAAVGMSCLSAVGNEEAIDCGYFEDCDESDEGEFEDCFCVNCGASISRTLITDFDEHESAVCPKCGMSTVVIVPMTSDEFRKKLCKYYREISAL